MNNDYKILIALEDILKQDRKTKKYVIQAAEEPENLPSPDICPMVNIFPVSKDRELERISGDSYTARLRFDIIMWEMSASGFQDAFRLIADMEENVYQVLIANKNIKDNVLTSIIGATTYEHIQYEDTFYVRAALILDCVIQQ